MILLLKNIIEFEEIDCKLDLNQIEIKNEEMIKILFNEIKKIKIKIKGISNNNDNKEEQNYKKIEELESKINMFIEKLNIL